jgi:uncharacterized SAM-binding protein YcdF (DUF218 family)
MNEIFLALGVESWKPILTTLVLPPVPMLVLVLLGARLMFSRRLLAWLLVLLGTLGIWFSCTTALAQGLQLWLLKPVPALTEGRVAELKKAPRTVIVVLGGGRRSYAPEYGLSTLNERSLDRLRYGVWLSRETGQPLAFSGGLGHGAEPGPSEAEIAARVAEREFGRALKYLESESRDTRENAIKTVELLAPAGVEQIVLVTHDYHMTRAMRNFERAIGTRKITLLAAPLGLPASGALRASDWLPTAYGFEKNRLVLHEWLGRLMGA